MLDAEVVTAVAPALSRVLLAQQDATLKSLDQLNALSVLARGVKRQQHFDSLAGVSLLGGRPPHPVQALAVS